MMQDQLVSVKRLQKDFNNSNKESYVANLALIDVQCQIQPAGSEETALSDGLFGQTYVLYTTTSGIIVGDNLTDSETGEKYRVKGIEDWNDIDLIPHFEMTVVKFEEEEII